MGLYLRKRSLISFFSDSLAATVCTKMVKVYSIKEKYIVDLLCSLILSILLSSPPATSLPLMCAKCTLDEINLS